MLRHATGYYPANTGQDTRAIQLSLGHKDIQHTVRYTELAAGRFKDSGAIGGDPSRIVITRHATRGKTGYALSCFRLTPDTGNAAAQIVVFRPIIHHQQNASIGNRVNQKADQGLGLAVDPMEIFENQHHRLFER